MPRWLTLNEPQVFAFAGHAYGRHAPGLTDWPTALRVADGALRGHAEAAEQIRAAVPGAEIGIALNLNRVEPASDSQVDAAAADRHLAIHRLVADPLFGRPCRSRCVPSATRAISQDGLVPDGAGDRARSTSWA